ncbi:MAG: hypothetical protein V7K98_14415 [Nostoc sp.]
MGRCRRLKILRIVHINKVEVDGDRLETAYRQLRRLQTTLEDLFAV